jgi:hypothetical protein
MPLEVLHGAFVFLGGFAASERTQATPPPVFRLIFRE